MRILTRYVLWELGTLFLVTLSVMTLLVFLILIGKEAVQNGLGLAPIIRILPFMLPQAMQFAVPGALLLSATVVYGRMSAANEVVALKSLGVSPMKLLWPALGLAGLASLAATQLNDFAISWGATGAQRVVLESLEDIAYGKLRTVRSFSTERLKVNVKRVEGRKLIHPTIQLSSGDGRPPSLITATAAELAADPKAGAVTIRLWDMDGDLGGWNVVHPGEFVQSFPLNDFLGRRQKASSPSSSALRELGDALDAQRQAVVREQEELVADVGAALLEGNLDVLGEGNWYLRTQDERVARSLQQRLATEPYRRWANGFSCLGFVMVGAPMAIRRRHGEFWGSFFACFMPILIVYYPLLVGCADQAKDGLLPPQSVWSGNVMLALWGIWLTRRVLRY